MKIVVTAGKATFTSMMCTMIYSYFTELRSYCKGPATKGITTVFASMPNYRKVEADFA